jgi:hypothetical protein
MKNRSFTRVISRLTQSDRALFVILCTVVIALMTEISHVRNYDLTKSVSVSDYLIMVFVYALGQYYFLYFINNKIRENEKKVSLNLTSYYIVRAAQYVLVVILVLVYLQMLFESHYSTIYVILALVVSYAVACLMLGILAQRMFFWFNVHRTTIVLMYGICAVTLTINAIIALGFVAFTLSEVYDSVGAHRGVFAYIPSPGSLEYNLNSLYNITSILSFVSTWGATALLLYPFSKKVGRTKYWIVVSLPLVYFLSQFPSVLLNLFSSALASDPEFFSSLLSIVFTVSKASGGIFFGLAFWILAKSTVQGTAAKDYLIIAMLGFVLLFVADQALVLLYVPYPPLGLASISFMGLSSYLILAGIYSAAVYVSQDSKLRRDIRKIAIRESKLIDSIGTAQMERKIESNITTLLKRNQDLIRQETGIDVPEIEENEMKSYLQEVLDELNLQRKSRSKDDIIDN